MRKLSTSTKRDIQTNDAAVILGPFVDFAEKGEETLFRFLKHCGIEIDALQPNDNRTAEELILEHYRMPNGAYDVEMVARDLARWPPIAARIHELRESAKFETDLNEHLTTTRKISGKSQRGH